MNKSKNELDPAVCKLSDYNAASKDYDNGLKMNGSVKDLANLSLTINSKAFKKLGYRTSHWGGGGT
jgi:hypothetical protein